MSTIAQMMVYDVFASRPAAGIAGRMFFCTDEAIIQRDNGSTWDTIFGGTTLTTKGDIQGFSTLPVRVAVGTDGFVATADSGAAPGWSWQAGGGGGGTNVLGTAKWSGAGSAVTGLVTAGNVSGVTRTGSGQYTVALTGSPTDYMVLMGIGDSSAGVTVQIDPVSSYGSTGFVLQVLSNNTNVYDSVGVIFIAIVKM